jgi:hypothetical protein
VKAARIHKFGLGGDASTDKPIDIAFYAAFEPQEDPVMDEMVAANLRPGRRIEI